jgi:L-threonylcarbamoyladenylate synthase
MNKIEILPWDSHKSIKKLVVSIRNNELSVTTTDTVPGFISNITEEGFFRLNKAKGSRDKKPYIILISGPKKLEKFVPKSFLTSRMRRIIEHCWPGPVTIIFKAKKRLPEYLQSKDGTIAIRCPKHKGLLQVLKNFDGLFSTSANKSGKSIPSKVDQIDPDLLKQIKYIVWDSIGNVMPLSKNQPSTILDFSRIMQKSGEGRKKPRVKVIRQGAFSVEKLERFYGDKFEK